MLLHKKPSSSYHPGSVVSLADLAPGSWGRVVSVEVDGALGRRLSDLGLIPGTRVAVTRRGPLGDPTLYTFRETAIALRRVDAAKVTVEVLPAEQAVKSVTWLSEYESEVVE